MSNEDDLTVQADESMIARLLGQTDATDDNDPTRPAYLPEPDDSSELSQDATVTAADVDIDLSALDAAAAPVAPAAPVTPVAPTAPLAPPAPVVPTAPPAPPAPDDLPGSDEFTSSDELTVHSGGAETIEPDSSLGGSLAWEPPPVPGLGDVGVPGALSTGAPFHDTSPPAPMAPPHTEAALDASSPEPPPTSAPVPGPPPPPLEAQAPPANLTPDPPFSAGEADLTPPPPVAPAPVFPPQPAADPAVAAADAGLGPEPTTGPETQAAANAFFEHDPFLPERRIPPALIAIAGVPLLVLALAIVWYLFIR